MEINIDNYGSTEVNLEPFFEASESLCAITQFQLFEEEENALPDLYSVSQDVLKISSPQDAAVH